MIFSLMFLMSKDLEFIANEKLPIHERISLGSASLIDSTRLELQMNLARCGLTLTMHKINAPFARRWAINLTHKHALDMSMAGSQKEFIRRSRKISRVAVPPSTLIRMDCYSQVMRVSGGLTSCGSDLQL